MLLCNVCVHVHCEHHVTAGDPQAPSITLGSTLLEHLLMSLNDTKKKVE